MRACVMSMAVTVLDFVFFSQFCGEMDDERGNP